MRSLIFGAGPIGRWLPSAEVRFGLHARSVGSELREVADEFGELKAKAGMETPNLGSLLACLPQSGADHHREVVS